jgi:hypothetical protein
MTIQVTRITPSFVTLRLPKRPEPMTLAQIAEMIVPYLPRVK